jgi:hypothetical protein
MQLSKVFSKGNTASIKELNELFDKAKLDYTEHVGINDETIEAFYDGDQWSHKDLKRALLYNAQGRPIYDFRSTYETNKGDEVFTRPRRTVNLIKGNVKSIVAMFSEVDPYPVAQKIYPYLNSVDISKLLDKHELLADAICKKENDLQQFYQLITEKALEYGRAFVQITIDENRAFTNTPIKFRYINPKNILVDPEAITLDEADYLCNVIRMSYGEMTEKYEVDLSDLTSEPDRHQDVVIRQWWLRQSGSKGKRPTWTVTYQYGEKQIYLKRQKKPTRELETFTFLPFECFRTDKAEKWWSQSMIVDIIESQKEYNKVKSEQDFNYMMAIEPPLHTNMDTRIVKTGMRPNGIMPRKPTDYLEPIKTTLIDNGMYDQRLTMIKDELANTFGSMDLMQGRRPTGVYSGRMLETLQKANQLKLKVVEGLMLDGIKAMYTKGLKLLAGYIGAVGVSVFNYKTGTSVIINEDDIDSTLYKVTVVTTDSNLMTNDAKYNAITQLMQYGKFQEKLHPYFISMMVNNAMPALIPDEVINNLKTDYEQTKAPQQNLQQPGVPGQPIGANPSTISQSGGQELSAPTDNTMNPELTPQELATAVADYKEELLREGIPEYKINEAFGQLMELDPEQVDQFINGEDVLPQDAEPEYILQTLDEFVGKAKNIQSQNI